MVVFMDLSKTFDTVSHNKLEVIGIRGVVLKLMKSYLKDRVQYTV